MNDSDKMRAEFEAWAARKGFSLKRIKWNDGSMSNYVYQSTFDAWQTWQAAYAARQKAVDERIEGLLREVLENDSCEALHNNSNLDDEFDSAMNNNQPPASGGSGGATMNGVLLIIRMGMDDLPIRFFETENDLGNWLRFDQQTFEEEIEQAANRLGCMSSHALRAEAIHFVDGTPVKIVHVMNFLPE